MKRFIFTGFSPNTTAADAWLAFKLLFTSESSAGNATHRLEEWFKAYFACNYAVSFDSGRTALEKALQAGGVGPADEVIVQALTCVVVANAITNLGAVPVYADCADEYTHNPAEVKKNITPKTKALVIQHTFGAPANLDALMAIAREHNLLVVEDCAHALGGTYNGKLLGTFGDVAMFSFGSDKVVSGVRGGMAITNNESIGKKLISIQKTLPALPTLKIFQHLLHPIFFWAGKKTYHIFVGKLILWLGQALHLINRIIYSPEKQGRVPRWFPAQLSNSLALLALEQIRHLDAWNKIRQKNAAWYKEKLMNKNSVQKVGGAENWLRFPVEVENPRALRHKALKSNIVLGDWYSCPVAPCDSSANAAHYAVGSCRNTERIGKSIVNLPTDPSLSQADLERVEALF